MICSVILELKNDNINRPFDYLVPNEIIDSVKVGQRVIVPFKNRHVMGIIIALKEDSSFTNLKEIEEVLDIIPPLNQELIDLALNMSKYYFCLYIQALLTMIPPALRVKHKKVFKVINRDLLPLPLHEIFTKDELIYNKNYQDYLNDLNIGLKNKSLVLIDEIIDQKNIKYDKYLVLASSDGKLNDAQKEIINLFNEKDKILKSEVVNKYSTSRVNTLIKKGFLNEIQLEKYRSFDEGKNYIDKKVVFSLEQEEAYQEIKQYYNQKETFLLHGVTGSGKTEIYLKVIEDILEMGKTAIFLVPEISLTPQIVSRIKGRFNKDVAVLHSGLSLGEKYDEWRHIINKEVKIVVGARSAIFAPLDNIGAIIIDESHEQSYKQFDQSPRYDAVMIGRIRAKNHQAITILGSATPSIESYYNALNKRYKLITLKERANKKKPPNVKIIDMKEELKKGNNSLFSLDLKKMIRDNIDRKEQTILLLNRRGFSSFVLCRNCGEVISCPHCEISLTYHKLDNTLRCHYCGYQIKMVKNCPKCKSDKIRYLGVGTEKVELELNELFKDAKVIRMDRDNTQNKGAHEKIIEQFNNHEADILVGTQMISKGLDFPKCSLVGILNADSALKYQSYLAPSEAYSLFVQTSGRAGRHDTSGNVIIQSYDTNHYAILAAKEENYVKFYEKEIKYRNIGEYPPFVKMIEILVSSDNYEDTYNEAFKISSIIKEIKGVKVLGPTEDYLVKLNGQYRFKIILKFKNENDVNGILNQLYLDYIHNNKFNIYITRG